MKLEQNKIYPYLYITPVLIIFAIYIFYPIIFSIVISLFKWDGFRPLNEAEFIFFDNYVKLINDKVFLLSLKNTFMFVGGTLLFQNFFGLTLALTLVYAKIRFSKVWRAVIFFPAILSPVIISLIWKLILANDGLFNQILSIIGLESLQRVWLGNKITPIFCIIFVNVWQWSGYNMVIYYAGLQSIPEDLIEAAKIDGASWSRIIFKIILPLLGGVASIAMVLNIIGGFKVFDLVYILTRGGPVHFSEVLTTYIFFHAFDVSGSNLLGYASSIAIVLTIISFIFALIRIRMTRTFEY